MGTDASLGHQASQWERQVCQQVTRIREERRMSQADLAERLSRMGLAMHQTTLGKIESGKRPMRLVELFAIALALDTPPASFMFQLPAVALDENFEARSSDLERVTRDIAFKERIMQSQLRAAEVELSELRALRIIYVRDLERHGASAMPDDAESFTAAFPDDGHDDEVRDIITDLLQGGHDGVDQ